MSVATSVVPAGVTWPIVLNFDALLPTMDEDAFFEFCRSNSFYHIERDKEGKVIIRPPTGGETGGVTLN